MDELLNTDLAAEWVTTHTPYEIVVRVSAEKIVYDGRNSDSEQEKVMNYLMKAYWCSFSDMENVILLKMMLKSRYVIFLTFARLICGDNK